MEQKKAYKHKELIECAKGNMFGEGNAQLPNTGMLMFDEIIEISATGGKYDKGFIDASLNITSDLWFFDCHFIGDPVMPGCLGLDALWQLTGFNLGWRGLKGRGRALGVGEVKFKGMVTPSTKLVRYEISFSRVIDRRLKLGISDGNVFADGEEIFVAKGLKVGLFEK